MSRNFWLAFGAVPVSRTAQLIHHQRHSTYRRQKHLALFEITLEKFVLDVGVYGHPGWFGYRSHSAKGLGQARQEPEVPWALVFRPLLRLHIQVNPVESISRMTLVELHDVPDMAQKRVAVFTGFICVRTR